MAGLRIRETRDGRAAAEPITVQVDTLDRQLAGLELLTYLKVDVEGGEIDCLLGGQQTIARLRPFISVEYGKPSYSAYGHTARTLFDLAAKMEYVPSDLFGNL